MESQKNKKSQMKKFKITTKERVVELDTFNWYTVYSACQARNIKDDSIIKIELISRD